MAQTHNPEATSTMLKSLKIQEKAQTAEFVPERMK